MLDKTLAQDPIFVVGYPRSGTTLLQALLATQGDLATFPETHFFSTAYTAKTSPGEETLSAQEVEKVLGEISQRSGLAFSPSEIEAIHALGSGGHMPIKGVFEFLVAKLIPSEAGPGCRWLEKTPDHAFFMARIGKLYPEAKFIGIIRHPLFAIHSRTKHFPPDAPDKLRFLAHQWVRHVDALDDFKKSFPTKIFVLKYEDLVKDPAGVIEKITRFLGIDFDIRSIQDFSKRAQNIVQPFENWKDGVKSNTIENKDESVDKVFEKSEILKIQSIVHNKMRQLGYEINYPKNQLIYNIFLKYFI
jgi:Sulfotransferase family